ncbi:hypothetical protein EWM64_g2860 [Hericium alpestre]|uniref:Uncharacterized protein n=1 Tax=Hericium alpestre TaxID=135208 RepID=A0A4Z0A4H5_9AGAM|nr:hypothetical protein EWM64_g2860 [Hericium alpestre]
MSTGKQAVNNVVSMVTQAGDNQAVFVGKEQKGKEVLRDPVYLEWVETIQKI